MSLLNDDLHLVRAAPSPGMDFAGLLRRGLAACQALSGATWTDYNEHDPGRTVLEAMCYALTDLAYRCGFGVADVLAERPSAPHPHDGSLVPGPRVLTTNALTATDYRKLIIDQALHDGWSNFRNVWVRTNCDRHTLLIEALDPGRDGAALVQAVAACYHRHRNTGEDLAGPPLVLELCPVEVHATVELAPQADPEAVAAALLFALQHALVPFVRVTSVDAALAAGVPPERVFDGPPPLAGVLSDTDLRPLRTTVATSELAGAMLAVDGVVALPALRVLVRGVPVGAGVDIGDAAARLAPSVFAPLTGLPLRFVCATQAVSVDLGRVQVLLDRLLAAAAPTAGLAVAQPGLSHYGAPPRGRWRDIAAYVSPQYALPVVYGLGPDGPALARPGSVDDAARMTARLAAARQLKAYLLFFEQWLTDAQAQLANAARLLSLEQDVETTYFTQSLARPDGPPGLANVLCGDLPPAPGPAPDPARYVVHLRDPDRPDRPVLRSGEFDTRTAAEVAGRHILARGAGSRHYQVRPLSGGSWQFWLEDDNGAPLAFGTGRHASAEDAWIGVAAVAGLVAALDRDPGAAARALAVSERGERAVRLLDAHGGVLLYGEHLGRAGQARWIAQLWRYGPREACYRTTVRPGGAWHLALADFDGQVFAHGAQRFASAADAEREIPALAALVCGLCCDTAAQARQIECWPSDGPHGGAAPAGDARIAAYERGWAQAVRARDPVQRRRNDAFDHLLARFGEQFDDRALARFDPRPPRDGHGFERDLAEAKRTFLRRYPVRGARNAASAAEPAADRMLGEWLGGARSRAQAAGDDMPGGPLSRVSLFLGMTSVGTDDGPPSFYYHDPSTDRDGRGAALLPAHGGLRFTSTQPAVLRALFECGSDPARYRIEPDGAGHALHFGWPGGGPATVVYRARDRADAEHARDEAVRFLHAYPDNHLRDGECLYAVEHQQLLSETPCQVAPFYDYRVSVILPDWPARFQQPAFRAFACQVVHENFPAHLAVDVYWLNQPDMNRFRLLYDGWRAAGRAGPEAVGGPGAALASFLVALAHGTEG